jgi:hypothetical protein
MTPKPKDGSGAALVQFLEARTQQMVAALRQLATSWVSTWRASSRGAAAR